MEIAKSRCVVCLAPSSKHCQGCKLAYYCGPQCQNADWPLHKAECKSKCTNYDESAVCAKLIGRLINDREARQNFAASVRSPPPALAGHTIHGVAVRCDNAVHARLALRDKNCDLRVNFLTKREQYGNTPPVCYTGVREGKDFVLVVEVKQHDGPLYASNAFAVAFDVDEPGQPTTISCVDE